MADLPAEEEFHVARKLDNKKWEKWIVPSTAPIEGENIKVAEDKGIQYWSLEVTKDVQWPWSFYVSKPLGDGTNENLYVSYQSDSDDVTLQKDNAQDWSRYFEVLLQPDGGVFFVTRDEKLLRTTSRNGATILQTSDHQGMSWFAKKSIEQCGSGTQPAIPSTICIRRTSDYWKSRGLRSLDYVPVSIARRGKQVWLVGSISDTETAFAFEAKDLGLQVCNEEGMQGVINDGILVEKTTRVLLESKRGSYETKSTGKWSVTIETRQTPRSFMAVKDEEGSRILHRVQNRSHAVSWDIRVVAFSYVGPKGDAQYFPSLSDKRELK